MHFFNESSVHLQLASSPGRIFSFQIGRGKNTAWYTCIAGVLVHMRQITRTFYRKIHRKFTIIEMRMHGKYTQQEYGNHVVPRKVQLLRDPAWLPQNPSLAGLAAVSCLLRTVLHFSLESL